MRFAFVALISVLAASGFSQLRPGEIRMLDDAMTLANVRTVDLGSVPSPALALAAHSAALKDPVAGLSEAIHRHTSATADELALLRTAYGLVNGTSSRRADAGVAEIPTTVPEPLRRPVGVLVAAISATNAEIRAATSRLSAGEQRTLIEALPRLAADDPTLPLDFAKAPSPDFSTVRKLLDLVDVSRIEAAGISLAGVVRGQIPILQAAASTPLKKMVFRVRGVIVELAGNGPDIHDRKDVGLCIDLGGDDRYSGRYAAGAGYTGVLIDLGGNDRYYGSDLNLGAGLLGVGLLFDLGGDDVYAVRSIGLGCGLAGLGLFVDSTGDDRYRIVGLGLGAAARGIGLFVDRLGDDAYFAGRFGQGFGTLQGVGWSVDGAGDDLYRGGEGVQAAARSGGFGLLTDLGGSDTYQSDSGQASSDGGYASLGDFGGDDHYVVGGNGQGFAASGGVAYLIDSEGDDAYLLKKGPGQAAAFGGLAILLDRQGNDLYAGTESTPATAYRGGVALMLDSEGDDRYLASVPFGGGEDGIALWADGGGRDRYGDGRADAQATAGENFAAYDAFGASETGTVTVLPPTPGSIPMPSPAEFAVLARQAVDGPDRRSAVLKLIGIGIPALDALAADPSSERAFVAVASRMGSAAQPTVARLSHSKEAVTVRLALRTAGYVALPPEAVLSALSRPELAVEAAEAAGRGKVTAAVPGLMAMAASSDVVSVRAAMKALALIGDPETASTAAVLVEHDDLAIRREAFRLLLSQPRLAQSTGQRLIATDSPFRQRIGFALLGRSGTPEALAALGPFLTNGSRDAKIGALLALDGHVPTELIAVVEALRRNDDPLVRSVAERIDVGR